eukprot:4020773-Lingulodinium_polyedra.AAC.1
MARGRWKAANSVRRYAKRGKLLRQVQRMSHAQQAAATALLANKAPFRSVAVFARQLMKRRG